MKGVYSTLGKNVTVEPLAFTEEELDAEAFLSMMAVGSSDSAPLYIQIILVRPISQSLIVVFERLQYLTYLIVNPPGLG